MASGFSNQRQLPPPRDAGRSWTGKLCMKPDCLPIPLSSLTRAHFKAWPIWSELYDADELLEIVSWGVSEDHFLAELERLNLGNEHAAYPVLDLSYVPDRMRIYIRAIIRCSDNRTLHGYVVNPDAYAFGVFVGNTEFAFNTNLKSDCREELSRLAIALDASPDFIKPLAFTTNFHDAIGSLIAGELAMP